MPVEKLVYGLVEEVLFLEENQNMAVKSVLLFVAIVVLAFGVFAFDFDGVKRDYRLWGKVRECPVGRSLSVDLVVVMTEYGCFSVSCVCGFLIKSLNDDFLGVDCLVASVYEQLGDSETGEHLG